MWQNKINTTHNQHLAEIKWILVKIYIFWREILFVGRKNDLLLLIWFMKTMTYFHSDASKIFSERLSWVFWMLCRNIIRN